jgi:catechol 2,3-dioxygenase-like lactoylglutathione lyase family enzyme
MVQTYGLTHINLAVRDLGRALRFYEQVFGLREYGRGVWQEVVPCRSAIV